jgi:hypothetical protein
MPLITEINNAPSSTLTEILRANQADTIKGVLDDKSTAFADTYTSLDNVGNNYQIAYFYNKQTDRLKNVLSDVANKGQENVTIANKNIALDTRNAEIKEWYFNNKLDTLFVFQLLFISLCLLAVISYLQKVGIFGVGFFGMLVGVLIIVLILVIANRAIYTEKVRDKRYWTKRGFTSVGGGLPGVNKKCK